MSNHGANRTDHAAHFCPDRLDRVERKKFNRARNKVNPEPLDTKPAKVLTFFPGFLSELPAYFDLVP